MPPPDFSRMITETLARRAGSMCSNVECRALTAGPTIAPDKSVNIGTAAHIYGAREGAARFRPDMTDVSRAEITNGIWLCTNCHKLIDNDPTRYPPELLFQWRNLHNQFVIAKLGTPNDKLRLTLETTQIEPFSDDSDLARRIILDRPRGWEYRLTAEFLRQYLRKSMRGWSDLQRNLYLRPNQIVEGDAFFPWLRSKNLEAERMVEVLAELYAVELARAWGKPGEPGDAYEIKHVCKLIQSTCEQLLQWEESIRFTSVDSTRERILNCLPGILGKQLEQLREVPRKLDEVADWIDANPNNTAPKRFEYTVVFKVPDDWADRITAELARYRALD
jgi:hypothetical protein